MIVLCSLNLQLLSTQYRILYKSKKSIIPYFFNLQKFVSKESNLLVSVQKMFKEPSFYCQGLLDPKYLLDSRTLEETWKSVIKRLLFNNTFDKSYINVWKTIKKRTKWHFQWAIYRKANICVLPFATVLLSFCILRILMKANNWYLWSWKLSTK